MTHTEIARIETELDEEHQELHLIVAELKLVRDAAQLTGELDRLATFLGAHFANEEVPGGLHDRLATCSDELPEQVRRLSAEHGEIIAKLRDLKSRTRAQGNRDLSDLLQRVARLVDDVRTHEAQEHAVITAAKAAIGG